MRDIIKNKFNIEKYIFITIMIVLLGLPALKFISYNLFLAGIISDSFSINHVYLLWFAIPFLSLFYILDVIINNKKIDYVDIIVYILIVLAIISTIFAINRKISIYGAVKRNEGLLSILSYYLILLNVRNIKNEKYIKLIIKAFIIIGLVQVLYAILQVYTRLEFIKHYSKPYMASGLSGNPNFFGGYMVMHTLIMFVLYLLYHKNKYLILSVIFFVGVCLASSTAPFLGLIVTIIFFIIQYRKNIKLKELFKIILLFIIVYIFIDYTVKFVQEGMFKNTIWDNYNITKELKKGVSSNFGNGRIELWKNSLPLMSKYYITGCGLDSFGIVYGIRDGIFFDKAHNIYLQIAITNGLLALIFYLILCFIGFHRGLKIKNKLYISIFIAFLGYSVQGFANISVIDVAPTFFTIFGIVLLKAKQ